MTCSSTPRNVPHRLRTFAFALLSLGWYAGPWAANAGAFDDQRQAPLLRAGDRWQFTLRLRAPHGTVNPQGFDYELWLWEQGVLATGLYRLRFVTHLDVDADGIERAIAAIRSFLGA